MIASTEMIAAKHQRSFFRIAAWISLVAPLATLGVVLIIFSLSGHASFLPPASRQFSGDLHTSALLVDVGSFVLGLFSLFGISRHGAALILWKAVPGLIISGMLGFYHFAVMMMSSIIC